MRAKQQRGQRVSLAVQQANEALDPSPSRPYLSAERAIAYLGLGSKTALYRLINDQALPFCRRGRLYLFDYRELDAWLRQHRPVEDVRLSRVG